MVVDRFENGDPSNDELDGIGVVPGDLARFQGGDWRGLTERLDYIAALGMSAIWISPIVANVPRLPRSDGYHGYWASDFTELNPRFGSEEDLQALVARAHALDLAVIVDVVPNHAGRVFTYDLDGDGVEDEGEAEPPFRETPYEVPLTWQFRPRLFGADGAVIQLEERHFRRQGVGNLGIGEERREGDFTDGLRDLYTEDEEVIEALIATYAEWAIRMDFDGFRIDAVPHVAMPFWERFCDGVRRRLAAAGKERFYMVGEAFERDAAAIAQWTSEGALDAGFDFPFKWHVVDAVLLGGAPPTRARIALEEGRALYRDAPQPLGSGLTPWEARVALLDNHDVPRIRTELDDPFAIDTALVALFTSDAIPVVYYGTEQELTGRSHDEARSPMWETGFATDGATYGLVRRLAMLRRESAALRRGTLTIRYASEVGGAELEAPTPDAGLLVWEREHEGEHVVTAINSHPVQSSRARVPVGAEPGTRLVDALDPTTYCVVLGDRTIDLVVPPRRALVLR